MIQNVIRKDFGAGGGQDQNQYNLGPSNGLVVTSDVEPGLTDYISVILKSSKHEQDVLVNRISMRALAAISDAENGASALLQARLNQVTEGGAFDLALFSFAIPLGCLWLRENDSSLDVTLESAQAGASKWSVASYFDTALPDHYFKWIESRTLTDKSQDVDQVWLFNAAGTEILAPFSRDVSVQVGGVQGSTLANLPDVAGYTAALGSVEAQGGQYCFKIFDSADGLHDAVQWNISGSEASDYRIICRQAVRRSSRVSRGVKGQVGRIQRTLAAKTPEQVQALKRSGLVIGGAREYGHALTKLNVPNEEGM